MAGREVGYQQMRRDLEKPKKVASLMSRGRRSVPTNPRNQLTQMRAEILAREAPTRPDGEIRHGEEEGCPARFGVHHDAGPGELTS